MVSERRGIFISLQFSGISRQGFFPEHSTEKRCNPPGPQQREQSERTSLKQLNNDRKRIRDSEQSRARSRRTEDHSRHNTQFRRDRGRKESPRQPTVRHRGANLRNNRNQGRSPPPGLNLELFYDQRRILRSESDTVAKRVPDRGRPRLLRHVIEIAFWVGLLEINRRRQKAPGYSAQR